MNIADKSASITAGGTEQTVVGTNPHRRYLMFQNTSDTDMRLNFAEAASASVGFVIPGNSYGGFTFDKPGQVPAGKLSVYCATTGKTFTCWEG